MESIINVLKQAGFYKNGIRSYFWDGPICNVTILIDPLQRLRVQVMHRKSKIGESYYVLKYPRLDINEIAATTCASIIRLNEYCGGK